MTQDPRGTIFQQGNIMRIDNALVEDVSYRSTGTGYVLISYAVPQPGQTIAIENLRLNVSRTTVVLNSFGQSMCLCNIHKGMWVNAVFSSAMTRSIPPQSNAFLIAARRGSQIPANVTTGRIALIDSGNRFLYTGNPHDVNSQTRFVITNHTSITDRSGNPVRLRSLRPGQMVRITHAPFQTASIPPQTTAFHIQLL